MEMNTFREKSCCTSIEKAEGVCRSFPRETAKGRGEPTQKIDVA